MKRVFLFAFISTVMLAVVFYSNRISKKLNVIEKYLDEASQWQIFQQNLHEYAAMGSYGHHYFEGEICRKLKKVPMADQLGIVTAVHSVHLKDVAYPYNGSIIKDDEGYLLFFRYDESKKESSSDNYLYYRSHIALARLDHHFNPIGSTIPIDTKSSISQDPRAFRVRDKIYVLYNDVVKNQLFSRQMHLAQLDPNDFSTQKIMNLDLNLQPVEKNWVPFIQDGVSGSPLIHFEYAHNPHKILRLSENTDDPLIEHLVFPSASSYQKMPWPASLGAIRGGTPAIDIGESYLAFFHSSFKEDKIKWYVMGAYTFEKSPPYRITTMSSYPIIFKGIYSSYNQGVTNPKLRAVFPAGVVQSADQGRKVLYVSFGENDCAQKIVTFDQEKLLQSLEPIASYR